MELRSLGRTGLTVSRLGLGTAALGRPAYMTLGRARDFPEGRSPQELAARTFSILDLARAAGVRYVDTARSYGQGEGFVADWLASRDVEPGGFTVGSKWGYQYVGAWRMDADVHETKNLDLPTLERQWEASRKVLWSHLDLYQVHSVTPDSPVLADEGVWARLALLRREFGVRIGATVSGPRQADAIRALSKLRVDGEPIVESIQATWNLLETSAGRALAEAHDQGVGVIVKEVHANGRLAAPDQVPAGLVEEAAHAGLSLDAWAISAALAQPWADVVLSGAVTRTQLESHLGANAARFDADPETFAEAPEAYWARRSELPWN
jgi:aryl-alcohol dehydrogenase-like predicted oxidoreductase